MSFKTILAAAAAASLILSPVAFAQTAVTADTPDSSNMTAPQNGTGVTTVNSDPHGRSTDVSKSGFNRTDKDEMGAPSASASGTDSSATTTVAPSNTAPPASTGDSMQSGAPSQPH